MQCPSICVREQHSRDPDSMGVIASDENVHRGFFPSDRTSGGVKASSITASHLWAGELSVWRICPLVNTTLDELITVLDPIMVRRTGEKFDQLYSTPAAAIRDHQIDGMNERSFSVLDECVIDNAGTKHPAHAHVAICERLKPKIALKDDTFIALQEGLKLLFEAGQQVWQR
jgi:hypothetical protein